MNNQSLLQLQAVNAAKRLDWESAVTYNQQLLEHSPQDIGALNRLGAAFLQLKNVKEAKKIFEIVIEIDKSNAIAKKQLEGIKQKKIAKTPRFSTEQFIEEPGTTKIVELHRLANKNELESLMVGQTCVLKPKNRYISIETGSGEYIGALPEDLSFRLTKLIQRGNTYACFVHSASAKTCGVYIKEITRSKRNQDVNSFPLNKTSLTAINDIDERFAGRQHSRGHYQH